MFKKVKFSDGRREFYIGKKKIFEYVKTSEFAKFIAQKFAITNTHTTNITNSLASNIKTQLADSTQSQALVAKLCGGGGRSTTFCFY